MPDSYSERLKALAKQRGIDHLTPPFPPGDMRELFRLSYLETIEAEAEHALESTSPEGRAAALTAWNEGNPRARGVTIVPWWRTQRIGRSTYLWVIPPPEPRRARSMNAWVERCWTLGLLLRIVENGPAEQQPDALALVLVDFSHALVDPTWPRDAKPEMIVSRFRTKYRDVRHFEVCLARGRRELDPREPRAIPLRGKVSRRKARTLAAE